MSDRETVITGLEFTKAMITFNPSTGEDIEPGNLNEADKTTYDACVGAIDLLKEQEWQTKRLTPTEPKVTINAYGTRFYYCPHCARPLMKSGIKGEPRHCVDCGQAVKWDG